jgi:NSS family neurotransmitter:Na+ symporter
MVYGAYLPKDVSIAKTAFLIATADTVAALLAGIAIFPIVFANGLEPAVA